MQTELKLQVLAQRVLPLPREPSHIGAVPCSQGSVQNGAEGTLDPRHRAQAASVCSPCRSVRSQAQVGSARGSGCAQQTHLVEVGVHSRRTWLGILTLAICSGEGGMSTLLPSGFKSPNWPSLVQSGRFPGIALPPYPPNPNWLDRNSYITDLFQQFILSSNLVLLCFPNQTSTVSVCRRWGPMCSGSPCSLFPVLTHRPPQACPGSPPAPALSPFSHAVVRPRAVCSTWCEQGEG